MKHKQPNLQIVVTVITPGGYETARAEVGRTIDSVHYAPFDMPWSARRTVRAIRPDALVLMETELWPNMLHYARRAGASILIVNGRISDRSFPRYLMARGIFKWSLSHFDRILTQSNTDAERFRAIGANAASISTLGNTKFDHAAPPAGQTGNQSLKKSLHLNAEAPVLVIASTRQVGEERILINAYKQLRNRIPGLALIHAPRHVERADEVAALMRDSGLSPIRRTALTAGIGETHQIVLDTFGELAGMFAIADAAFIGNSLVPPGGGQNLLQPLAHGVPAVYGPYMQNFRDLEVMAADAGVGFCVKDEDELVAVLTRLLNDHAGRQALAARARNLIESNRGVSARYASEILALLREKRERA